MPKEKETALVLYRAGEPYTTSEIISQETGIARRKIRDAIKKHKTDIATFGKVASYEATLQSGPKPAPPYYARQIYSPLKISTASLPAV